VKQAPAGSGRAPVASGTGAEARAGAGCVGAALVMSGWSRRRPRAHARAAGREVAGSRLGGAGSTLRRRQLVVGGGDSFAAAAAGGHAGARDRMKRCGQRSSIKIVYFRRPPRRPSDIILCSTVYLTVVEHKLMSDSHSNNPRI
jgi:hypothetical protein